MAEGRSPALRLGAILLSLLLLIDGYNVVAPIAPPARGAGDQWLHRERMRLISRLVEHLDHEVRSRTCVVFDAASPPRDRPQEFSVESLAIRFAVGYPEADDLLEEMIAAHSSPKQLAVVSSDNRVQVAARRRGCTVFDSQSWLDNLLEDRVGLATARRSKRRGAPGQDKSGQGRGAGDSETGDSQTAADDVSEEDVQQWLKEFGF